ncbi:MAG: glycerate kinase [Acidobacteria bacterium]|nr:MAG: glycerate kinase [Acidobacteriota bacterium]
MKIVIAMDSFKGTLTAPAACTAVARGILSERADVELVERPMADGGEGTAQTLIAATGGEWAIERVMGPLPEMQVDAGYAWLPGSEPGALIEMAQASGLILLAEDRLDPLRTTTYGTGQLLQAACDRGAERLWLAVGGSATVDGGVGAAMALGWSFRDRAGNSIGHGGAELERIQSIVPPTDIDLPPVEVLCDVDNPLCGKRGAAAVYGPQKGATPQMVERLDAGLAHLADVVRRDLGREIEDLPGAGAAGGLAAGGVAFMDATLVSGIEAVMKATSLAEHLATADWVVTGEGRFDEQSLYGKVVSGISNLAQASGTRVAVLAGSVELSSERATRSGISAVEASRTEGMSLEEALERSEPLLVEAARRFARDHLASTEASSS